MANLTDLSLKGIGRHDGVNLVTFLGKHRHLNAAGKLEVVKLVPAEQSHIVATFVILPALGKFPAVFKPISPRQAYLATFEILCPNQTRNGFLRNSGTGEREGFFVKFAESDLGWDNESEDWLLQR